uniref:Uncharacterized protein n=1 Tax=Anguilla anguilla TaxID=7936 RepID=A0A0E9U5C1_ANGAN
MRFLFSSVRSLGKPLVSLALKDNVHSVSDFIFPQTCSQRVCGSVSANIVGLGSFGEQEGFHLLTL